MKSLSIQILLKSFCRLFFSPTHLLFFEWMKLYQQFQTSHHHVEIDAVIFIPHFIASKSLRSFYIDCLFRMYVGDYDG